MAGYALLSDALARGHLDRAIRQEVAVPFVKGKVSVWVDFKRHPAIKSIEDWTPALKKAIQDACFTHYRDKVASIGPGALPVIRRPAEVWKHLDVREVRIDPTVDDTVVVHVIPAWDEDEQMEWCIRGAGNWSTSGSSLDFPSTGTPR